MKTAVIANPHSAGGRTAKRWPGIEQRLRERLGALEVRFTEGPGHGIEIAREMLAAGCERIIGAGGDGTLNEIANGFIENDVPVNPEACLGILPLGTGGDLRRTLGVPSEMEAALDVLAAGNRRTIDLGKITYRDHGGTDVSRYFVNVISFGMGGEVAARSRNLLTRLGGQLAFFWATLKVFAIYRGKEVELRADDGEPQVHKVLNVAVGNGLYHGGGMYVCPEAVLDDGLLEVTVIDNLGVLTLLKDVSYLYDGKIYDHRKVSHFRARKLVATAGEVTRIEVDGEPLGTLPAEVTVLPGALRVVAG